MENKNWSKGDSFQWLRYIRCDAVRDAFVRCCTEGSAGILQDDAMLLRIALESRENGEALTAFRGICRLDDAAVYKLCRYTWNPELRQLALNKLEHRIHSCQREPVRRALPEIESEPLQRLLRAGAEDPRLLYDFARGEADVHRFFYNDTIPRPWHRVAAVCQDALNDPQWLGALAKMGGPVGLAALVRGGDALLAGELLLATDDKRIMRAAISVTNDRATLSAFAGDREKPYAERMQAYAKLDDREALREHAERPYVWNRITWKYGYCMDSSNYAVITACRSKEQLQALYGAGYDHLVDRWMIRIASTEEDAAAFIPPKRRKAPDFCRDRLSPQTLALCERICRSIDSKLIHEGLCAVREQADALFLCAVEGMAFCRGRSAHLLGCLPGVQEQLGFIAQHESNPAVVNKVIDGLTDIDTLKAIAERGLSRNTADKAKCRIRLLTSMRRHSDEE